LELINAKSRIVDDIEFNVFLAKKPRGLPLKDDPGILE
jgi:hypothetical protein